MAFNSNLPADTTAPEEIRENFRALKEDKIVAADTATRLDTMRTISLTGDATGSAMFDGSADASIVVEVIGGDADTLEGKTVEEIIAEISASALPIGSIIMWSGTISTIPTNWNLCDGSNGTPDLRNRFVVGAGQDDGEYIPGNNAVGTGYYSPGSTGGEDKHKLTIAEMPKHHHDYAFPGSPGPVDWDDDWGNATVTKQTSDTGGDEQHENRPPYFALAFIMKTN